jgi:hypothetical protein
MLKIQFLTVFVAIIVNSSLSLAQEVYWLSPSGSDSASGLSEFEPLQSLEGLHTRVSADRPMNEVIVAIEPGQYFNQTVVWRYFQHQTPIRFMSADQYRRDYLSERVSVIRKPHFMGCDSAPIEGNARDGREKCHQNEWFLLHVRSSNAHNKAQLHFTNIKVTNYLNGLRFSSPRNNPEDYNGGHHIENCEFHYIGNVWTSNPPGVADGDWKAYRALGLTNSRYTKVINNSFRFIDSEYFGVHLHAIYMAHHASYNEIRGNHFESVTGDAIRVRDASDFNVFNNNTILNSGKAAYSDWFCNHERVECSKYESVGIAECPSQGNEFFNNEIGNRYKSSRGMRELCFYWDRAECAEPSEIRWNYCSLSAERVNSYGNTFRHSSSNSSGGSGKKKKSKGLNVIFQWLSGLLN